MNLLHFVLLTGLILSVCATQVPYSVRRGGGGGGRGGGSGRGGSKGSFGRAPVSGGKSSNKSRADCFPSTATVLTKQHGAILMHQLAAGDLVQASSGWSPIYTFSHADGDAHSSDFVRIYAPPHVLTLSSGHYLFVHERGEEAARNIHRGDGLYDGKGQLLRVETVHFGVVARGLYNPHTVDGTIVVDGVLASTFTEVIKPATAKSMLAPFRTAYWLCGHDLSGGLLTGSTRMRNAFLALSRCVS